MLCETDLVTYLNTLSMEQTVRLVAVWCVLQVIDVQGLSVYSTRGTHYQIGFDVAQHFRQSIQEYYSTMTDLHTKLLPFVDTPDGAHIYDDYFKMAFKYFPQYVEELRGISDGAKIPFKQVFTNHIWDELSVLIGLKHPKKSCTDVYINNNIDTAVQFGIGHNEDGSPDAKSRAYLLHATIINNMTGAVEENFTSFTYPGELPGDAYGFNMHGVIITMNAMYPASVGIGAVPRDFVLRATFAVRNQKELESLMYCDGTGVGYGYNLNVAYNSPFDNILYSYEVAPIEDQSKALVSKYSVGTEVYQLPGFKPTYNTTGSYFHFNLYNHTVVKQIESDLTSSYHRQERVAHLPPVKIFEDVNNVLGDTYDELYPIYRTPRPSDEVSTLSTAIFDLGHCRLYIYTDNPKTSSGPAHTLTLPSVSACHSDHFSLF